jgi:hypothetical protein
MYFIWQDYDNKRTYAGHVCRRCSGNSDNYSLVNAPLIPVYYDTWQAWWNILTV